MPKIKEDSILSEQPSGDLIECGITSYDTILEAEKPKKVKEEEVLGGKKPKAKSKSKAKTKKK